MAKRPVYDVPCKLGTVPKLVRVHGSDKIEVDRLLRVMEIKRGKWQSVLVTRINDDGYFFADLHSSFPPVIGKQPPAGQYAYSK